MYYSLLEGFQQTFQQSSKTSARNSCRAVRGCFVGVDKVLISCELLVAECGFGGTRFDAVDKSQSFQELFNSFSQLKNLNFTKV